ncbi:helix-turn-helix domain-containing protein [Alphaproteobacteria bacterium HT1-32]|nr:helix-turn-helix domain-containing protein [Alphaproteobacteria bacterium HT1-32]
MIKEKEAAALLNYSQRTLQGWRLRGGGPKFVKFSKRAIRYRVGDLLEWIAGNTFHSTSEYQP